MSAMLTLEQAQERLLALAPPPQIELRDLSHVATRDYLAEDVVAQRTQPAADLSAMDGYAICGDGPWERIGESRAGEPFGGTLAPGQCTRISTGAHMPHGADSVLIQENAAVVDATVALADGEERPAPGRHVRRAGFDFAQGDTVLRAGTRLNAARAALALAAGASRVPTVVRPTIAVLDSGDELVPVGRPVAAHQIPATNGVMLSWLLAPYAASVETLGPVADDHAALAEALERASEARILVTSGGASVGDHDLMQQALRDWGARIDFWKVAIKPGKPLMIATREQSWGRQVILGLPGNPVSSFVTAFLFALPLLRKAMGAGDALPRAVTMRAGEPLPAVGKRREFLRGVIGDDGVHLAASQDSSALVALAQSDCLIDRPAGSEAVAVGEPVQVFLLENG